MTYKFLLLGALFFSAAAHAESIKIGRGSFLIKSADKIDEGRMVMYAVELKYQTDIGSADVKSILYCNVKKADYIDAKGAVSQIKVRESDRNSSISSYLWFKYCPNSKGMTRSDLKIFNKYD